MKRAASDAVYPQVDCTLRFCKRCTKHVSKVFLQSFQFFSDVTPFLGELGCTLYRGNYRTMNIG